MRWLHISDIHYNPVIDGRSTKELRNKLPSYLQQVVAQFGGRVDEVFVTGDFRHALYQKDTDAVADASVTFVCELAASVGVDNRQNIHIVPGNHDFTRFAKSNDIEKLDRIIKAYKTDDGLFQKEDAKWLLRRFSFFKRVSNIMYSKYSTKPVWPKSL